MESKTLKHFVGKDVEILVAGAWVEGYLKQISDGIITLLPFPSQADYYGPTALKMDAIQAIRQVKPHVNVNSQINEPVKDIQSAIENAAPGKHSVIK